MSTYELPDELVREYKLTGRVDPVLSRALGDQLPKPSVPEPTEWGSVVSARFAEAGTHNPHLLYVRLGDKDTGEPWADTDFGPWAWSEFADVEVLRVGVGESEGDPWPATVEDCTRCVWHSPVIGALVDEYQLKAWEASGVNSRSDMLREFAWRVVEAGKAA